MMRLRRLPAAAGPTDAEGSPGWLVRRLAVVVATFAPDTRTRPEVLWAGGLIVALVLGARLAGVIGAVAGGLALVAVPLVGPRLAERRRRALDRRRLPERAADIARSVRAGHSLPEALARAAADDLPTARRWARLVEQVALGRSFDDALAEGAGRANEEERLVLTGLRIGALEGGAVAAAAATMASRLRQEVELVDRRRVLTTQARTSAQVLAVLPIVFAGVMVTVRGPAAWVQPLGLVCLAAGGVLELAGVFWMRRLLGRLR